MPISVTSVRWVGDPGCRILVIRVGCDALRIRSADHPPLELAGLIATLVPEPTNAPGCRICVILDLQDVLWLETEGPLVRIAQSMIQQYNGLLLLCGVGSTPRAILELTRLHRVMPIFPDAESAAAAMARQARPQREG
jgi:anti-anti-sigma regulatory factor